MSSTKLRALILEDNIDDAALILLELKAAGFDPDWMRVSSKKAYTNALLRERSSLDIILADYHLPQFGAPEALEILKSLEVDIPFIVVSGVIREREALQIVREGASDYLYKDRLSRLGMAVTHALREKQLRQELFRLNERLTDAYDATLQGWAHALELRDDETREHTERVTVLTVRLARRMGINGETLMHLRRGAMLHDIGKLGVPDTILLKEGPLDFDEWRVMKMHPTYAFNMLSQIEYLTPALDIPCYHHEKWDGSGYPYGLQQEEIPLPARLFAIVDVWDALNSRRPYRREPWAKEKIFEYIEDQSGQHFDPDVVGLFLEMVQHDPVLTVSASVWHDA